MWPAHFLDCGHFLCFPLMLWPVLVWLPENGMMHAVHIKAIPMGSHLYGLLGLVGEHRPDIWFLRVPGDSQYHQSLAQLESISLKTVNHREFAAHMSAGILVTFEIQMTLASEHSEQKYGL